MKKRILSMLIAIVMLLGILPAQVFAATGSSGSAAQDDNMTVFDALGFSTGAPSGYNADEGVTSSPYGKTYTTMLEVRELLLEMPRADHGALLYGYNYSTQGTPSYSSLNSTSSIVYNTMRTDLYSISVEGNFSTSNNGRKSQVATLTIRPARLGYAAIQTSGGSTVTAVDGHQSDIYSKYKNVRGEIALYTHDATGTSNSQVFKYGSVANFDTAIGLGNPIDVDWLLSAERYNLDKSNFNDNGDFINEYMAYNYLKMTAGDFDGDGLDEIAVYIPELTSDVVSQARVEVYDLQSQSSDSETWSLAYSIPMLLYDVNGEVRNDPNSGRVPNMVSLTAGDFNQDGIDDLAISYGYLSSDQRLFSTDHYATIRWGAIFDSVAGSYMLSTSADFRLTNNSGQNLVRTTLTTGDADGDGRDELVLGGNVLETSTNTRYIAVYEWTGSGFSRSTEKNFDIFETHSGTSNRVYEHIQDENTYYSVARTPANIAVGKFLGVDSSPCIYIDSLLIGYGSDGDLTILDMIRNNSFMLNGTSTNYFYVEYGAQAADLVGNGTDVLVTRVHYYAASDLSSGIVESVLKTDHMLNKNRDFWSAASALLFSRNTEATDAQSAHSVTVVANSRSSTSRTPVRFALPDCDANDTVIMEYTGEHYYTYADPEVLAVLASPPHFKDLEAVADNQMMESTTSYATSSGSGSGTTRTHGFSAGVYASYEQDVTFLGVTLFSYEMETEINNSFTWDFQQTASIEYEISYGTQVGQDSVVLYAIPVETYVYRIHTPDGATQIMNINRPYEPSVEVVSLEKYNSVYEQYPEVLTEIDGAVFTHTVGMPATYPSSENALPPNRTRTLTYPGDPMRIGYGQVVTSQTIAMTSEQENSFSWNIDISFKAGAGSGGFTAGITLGTSHGAGSVSLTTSGSSYSAEMQALPAIAEDYGYSFNWRMTSFLYEGKYPVVTYIVSSVTQPPLLPTDFSANEELTTDDTLVLEWDYAGAATGFNLFRRYTTTAGSDFYLIDTVSMNDFASINSDGSYHFRYADTELSDGTEYCYQIQTIGTALPNLSVPSADLVVYTKPRNAPVLNVTERELHAQPDGVVSSTVVVENLSEVGNARLYYQWEKLNEEGGWTAVTRFKDRTLSIEYGSDADAGVYRCRVTAMMDTAAVSVYSPKVTVTFSRRTAVFDGLTIDSKNGTITAHMSGGDTLSVPSGNVIFTLNGSYGEASYSVALENGSATLANAGARDGVYAVTCYYAGNRVFYPAVYDPEEPEFYAKGLTSGSSTHFLSVRDSYTYGDNLDFTIYTIDANGSITDTTVLTADHLSSITFMRYSETWGRYYGFSDRANGRWQFVFPMNPDWGNDRAYDRFSRGLAGWVGSYCFYYTVDGVKRPYYFSVTPAKASITGLESFYTYSKSEMESLNFGELKKNLTYTGFIDFNDTDRYGSDLSIFQRNYNSTHHYRDLVLVDRNGTEYTNPSDAPASSYTLSFSALREFANFFYYEAAPIQDNYDIEWPSATFIITSDTYQIGTMINESSYGKVSIVNPAGATTAAAGQTVIFRCEPYDGYEVLGWGVIYGNEWFPTMIDYSGSETISYTVYSDIRMMAFLGLKETTLTVNALPKNPTVNGEAVENKVVTDDPYFTSGNIYSPGYEITFTPEAAEGWHFVRWEYAESGKSTQYSNEPTFTVTMPNTRVTLNAVFERDICALTLGEHLAAYDAEGNLLTKTDAIAGDTQITVRPALGYEFAPGSWTVNGESLAADPGEEGYTFTLVDDTTINAEMSVGTYNITVTQPQEGGSAQSTVTGEAAGGGNVTFTAIPERGYSFLGWQDENGVTVETEATFTVVIADDMSLTPVFEAQTRRTVRLLQIKTSHGTVAWRIEDANGNAVEAEAENTTVASVTVALYPGERLVLTATPASGRIVSGWAVNEVFQTGSVNTVTYSYDQLPDNVYVYVVYKPVTYYSVNYDDPQIIVYENSVNEGRIQSGDRADSGTRVLIRYTGEDGVLAWYNGDELLGTDAECIVEPLQCELNIRVETGWKVSFNVDGISAQVLPKDGVSYAVRPTDPKRLGYAFEGWYTSDGTLYDFSQPVTGNIALSAKWTHVHNWQTNFWVYDATGHWHACGNTGCDGTKSDYAEHTPDREQATETEAVRCTVCGYVITPPVGHTEHTLVLVPHKAPTCLEAGMEAYYVCTVCGKMFTSATGENEITDLSRRVSTITNHRYGDEWQTGEAGHWHACEVCGEADEVLAHTPAEEWSGDDAGHWQACTACGYHCNAGAHSYTDDADERCDVCGHERHVHKWSDSYEHDQTDHWLTCSGCDETNREAHTWGEWSVSKEATQTENGERQRACTVCGAQQSETIPATGGGEAETEPPVSEPPVSDQTTAPTEDNRSGCASSMSAGLFTVFAMSICGGALLRRRRRED